MRYYKIYFQDEQNRQRVKLLETEKSLSEIQKEFGEAEELFESEYRIFKKISVEDCLKDFDRSQREELSLT